MSFNAVVRDWWPEYFKWFRPGRCRVCGKWTWWILKSESAHESCWLLEK